MTERAQIIVPTQGERRDVGDLIQTPEMMRRAINVLVYDGTLRPRPGMSRKGFSQAMTNWTQVADGVNCIAVFKSNQMLRQNADNSWEFSVDYGISWSGCTVNGPSVVTRMEYCRGTYQLLAFDSLGQLWRADVTTFPTPSTITFTLVGYIDPAKKRLLDRRDRTFYDEANDVLWYQCAHYEGDWARVHCVENASTITAANWSSNYSVSPPLPTYYPGGVKLVGTSLEAGYSTAVLRATSETFVTGTAYDIFLLEAGNMEDGDGQIQYYDRFGWKHFAHQIYITDHAAYGVKALRGQGLVTFTYTSGSDPATVPFYTWLTGQMQSALFQEWAEAASGKELCLGVANVRTVDSWATKQQYEDYPGDYTLLARVWAVEGGNNYYIAEQVAPTGVDAWFVHGQVGTGVAGDPLIGDTISMFQGDLDTQPSSIFLGNTKTLLKLDRGTLTWLDVSPPDYTPDANTTISGSADDNRWVWRVVEKGSDRYIVATNGQVPPLKYSEDTYSALGGFAVLGDADLDGTLTDETAAPHAHCMALANNRLILGNLPADTEYSIRISAPQDFDTGYLNEYKLADTTGAIVSMRELNAITIAILKTDAIYHGISQVEFMGQSAPMRFELIKAGIVGPCSDASVVYLPDGRLCWLGRDGGVYVYDGTVPRDIGRHIRHAIYPFLDTDRFGWAWGVVDTKRNLLWFFFPTKTEPYGMNTGIVMSIDQGETWPAWTVQYPADWEVMSGLNMFMETDRTYGDFLDTPYSHMEATPYNSFEGGMWEMVTARRNNTVYQQIWSDDNETNYTDGGYPIYVKMETGWYDFDDIYAFDTFHELHHIVDLQAAEQLTWTVFSEQSDGSKLSSSSNLTNETTRHRTTYRQTGRRHKFMMEGWIQKDFRWGGAVGLYSRRGGR